MKKHKNSKKKNNISTYILRYCFQVIPNTVGFFSI